MHALSRTKFGYKYDSGKLMGVNKNIGNYLIRKLLPEITTHPLSEY